MAKNNNCLLIPLSVEGILVNDHQNGSLFANHVYDYRSLENGRVLGDAMVKDHFAQDSNVKKGAHLHWALPDALTKGYQTNQIKKETLIDHLSVGNDTANTIIQILKKNKFLDESDFVSRRFTPENNNFTLAFPKAYKAYEEQVINILQHLIAKGEVKYPAVPTCWQVVRLVTDYQSIAAPKIKVKSWIVESDYISQRSEKNQNQVTFPLKDVTTDTFYCSYLGKKTIYEEWDGQNEKTYLDELTAIGPGDPMFASYYPSCKSVFGFHDPLDDVESADITYMIVGWYRDLKKDPLDGDVSQELWMSCMEELGWSLEETNREKPLQTICHGVLTRMEWRGEKANYKNNNLESPENIVLANNSVEALSTLIATKLSSEKQDIAKLLEGFNYELLSNLDRADGLAKLEEKIHEKMFNPVDSGSQYIISATHSEIGATRSPVEDFPAGIGRQLARLNTGIAQEQTLQEELISWQWELYSAWYKYISKRDEPEPFAWDSTQNSSLEYIEKYIDTLSEKIITFKKQLEVIAQKNGRNKHVLEENVQKNLPDHQLNLVTADKYWQAEDPVILFAGSNVSRSFRHGYDGEFSEDGRLKCRLENITGIQVDFNGDKVTITEKELMPYIEKLPLGNMPVSDILNKLLVETVILDTVQSKLIAVATYETVGITPSIEEIKALGLEIAKMQTVMWNGCAEKKVTVDELAKAAGLIGDVPAKIGLNFWIQAWVPMYMEWLVNVIKNDDRQSQFTNIQQDWMLGDIDYTYSSEKMSRNSYQLKGSVLLTPHAPHHLQQVVKNYQSKLRSDDPEIAVLDDICNQLATTNVLSQRMSGFNVAQCMMKETLQFPVFDVPFENPQLAKKIATLIENNNDYSPVPESIFNPIQNGFMHLERLWLVDAFGQVQEVDVHKENIISEELTTRGAEFKNHVTLKPRYSQPARIKLDWISSKEKIVSNSDPSTTPVCGWLLPNHIEKSLMIYESNGELLGALRLFYQSKTNIIPQWTPAPNKTIKPEKIENIELREFVKGVLNYKGKDNPLAELLETIDVTLGGIDPLGFREDQSLSVLIGRPLALVTARLGLELKGLPAFSQSWQDLGKYNTYGFEKAIFPVRLGDASQLCDGLLGYFIKEEHKTYNEFHVSSNLGECEKNKGYISHNHQIGLSAEKGNNSIDITMIVDPRAGIHITTGFLPVLYKELSPDYVASALEKINVTFEIAPLINTSNQWRMPLPAIEDNYEWKWLHHKTTNDWEEVNDLLNVSKKADFQSVPQVVREGWLKLSKKEEQ